MRPLPSWNLCTKYFLKYSNFYFIFTKSYDYYICVWYSYHSDIWMDYPKLISEKWNLTAKFNGKNRVSGPIAYAVLQWGRFPPTFLSHVQMRALVRAFTWIDHEQYKSRKYRERLQIATQRWVHALGFIGKSRYTYRRRIHCDKEGRFTA